MIDIDRAARTPQAAETGQREGIGYFARFGITERMIRETISAALSRGGEHADVYFQPPRRLGPAKP